MEFIRKESFIGSVNQNNDREQFYSFHNQDFQNAKGPADAGNHIVKEVENEDVDEEDEFDQQNDTYY